MRDPRDSVNGQAQNADPASQAHNGAPILKEALLNAVTWFALTAYAFVTSTLLVRVSGQEAFGVWATIASFRSVLLILDGGLAMGVTRDVALVQNGVLNVVRRVQTANTLYRILAVVTAILSLGAAGFPGSFLALDGDQAATARAVTVALGLDAAIALAGAPLAAALRGIRRFDVLAVGGLTQAIVGTSLLIPATLTFGLVGAALGLLAARLVATLINGIWLHRNAPDLFAMRTHELDIAGISRFALPLWLVGLAGVLGLSADVPVVGYFFGAAAAGQFAVGALAPFVLVGAIWVVLDSTFPRFAQSGYDSTNELARQLTLGGSILAGLAFSWLALNAGSILQVWVGHQSALAEATLVLYSVAWAANTPAHVLSLAAIGRYKHAPIAAIALTEAGANLGLTLALIPALGPVAPAFATLATMSVSNLLVVPVVLGKRLGLTPFGIVGPALVGYLVGVGGGLLGWLAGLAVPVELGRVAIAGAIPAGIGIVLIQVLRHTRLLQRLTALVFLGGWRVKVNEWAERNAARDRVQEVRATAVTIWLRSEPPLVTVRIATYNRGRLIAERAIASALRQTYRNLEVLVVGDHCDAVTEAAVREVRDPRLRFHNLPERGTYPTDPAQRWRVAGAAPMNWALDHARGEWIAPLDDDDEFTDDHIEVLLGACRQEAADFAYGVADVEQPDGSWRPVGSWPMRHGNIIHAAVLYRGGLRIFKHNVESWRLDEPGDWNLWRRMREAGAHATFVDRVVCRHYAEKREVIGNNVPRSLIATPVRS